MDTQSQDFYKSATRIFPYLVMGSIGSIILNVIMMNAMKVTSPSSLGWPIKIGEVMNGETNINIFGFVLNILIWSAILSVVIPVLKGLFIKQ